MSCFAFKIPSPLWGRIKEGGGRCLPAKRIIC